MLLSELKENKVVIGDDEYVLDLSPLVQSLPSYLDLDKIDVDVDTILDICKLTRTSALSVFVFDEKGEDDIDVKGVGADGTAVGSASASKAKDKFTMGKGKELVDELTPMITRSLDFRDANLFINFAKTKDFANLRDPALWANFLDESFKEQLMEISKKKLAFDGKEFVKDLGFPIFWSSFRLLAELDRRDGERRNGENIAVYLIIIASLIYFPVFAYLIQFVDFRATLNLNADEIFKDSGRYDIPSSLTLGNFEYDRLISIFHTFQTKTLVGLAVPQINDVPEFKEDQT